MVDSKCALLLLRSHKKCKPHATVRHIKQCHIGCFWWSQRRQHINAIANGMLSPSLFSAFSPLFRCGYRPVVWCLGHGLPHGAIPKVQLRRQIFLHTSSWSFTRPLLWKDWVTNSLSVLCSCGASLFCVFCQWSYQIFDHVLLHRGPNLGVIYPLSLLLVPVPDHLPGPCSKSFSREVCVTIQSLCLFRTPLVGNHATNICSSWWFRLIIVIFRGRYGLWMAIRTWG